MKVLIIYDSLYGQTESIAQAIAGIMGEQGSVRVVKAGAAGAIDLHDVDVLLLADDARVPVAGGGGGRGGVLKSSG